MPGTRSPHPPRAWAELVPSAAQVTEQRANNRIEADDSWLKARLRPIRGPNRPRSATMIAARQVLVLNLRATINLPAT
jgi:hypothetical protein